MLYLRKTERRLMKRNISNFSHQEPASLFCPQERTGLLSTACKGELSLRSSPTQLFSSFPGAPCLPPPACCPQASLLLLSWSISTDLPWSVGRMAVLLPVTSLRMMTSQKRCKLWGLRGQLSRMVLVIREYILGFNNYTCLHFGICTNIFLPL